MSHGHAASSAIVLSPALLPSLMDGISNGADSADIFIQMCTLGIEVMQLINTYSITNNYMAYNYIDGHHH